MLNRVLADAAAVRDGQQAAQASFQQPQAAVESLVNEGRRLFEDASQTAQRAAEGGKETLDQAMQQVLISILFISQSCGLIWAQCNQDRLG